MNDDFDNELRAALRSAADPATGGSIDPPDVARLRSAVAAARQRARRAAVGALVVVGALGTTGALALRGGSADSIRTVVPAGTTVSEVRTIPTDDTTTTSSVPALVTPTAAATTSVPDAVATTTAVPATAPTPAPAPAPAPAPTTTPAPATTAAPAPTGAPPSVSVGAGADVGRCAANGHAYEFVPADSIKWAVARDFAAQRNLDGRRGHLATITSAAEQQCVMAALPAGLTGWAWIGGSDAAEEGTWMWVEDPDAGLVFWIGGPLIGGDNAGKPVAGVYSNFEPTQEPGNSGVEPGEDFAAVKPDGQWADGGGSAGEPIAGFVVEWSTP
jgi:hypothetical protein